MNYNDQVKYELPILITTVGDSKPNTEEQKTIKISDIIKIKK